MIDAGATVTESTTGDFYFGDINRTRLDTARIDGNMTISAENGGDVGLDMQLEGAGSIVVNGTVGTTLRVSNAAAFQGNVQFNGAGDEVAFPRAGGGGTIFQMNSTGTNRLALSTTIQTGVGTVIFN